MNRKPTYEELEQRVLELEGREPCRNIAEKLVFPQFEKHDSIILIIDPDSGDIINANIAAQNYYGYSIKNLKQMKIQEINMLSPDKVAEKRQQAANEKLNYFEFPHRLSSGEIRTVEVHSSPIILHGKKLLLSIIHDITDRKLAEEALYESEKRYRNLVINLQEGIWQIDEEANTIYVNSSMAEMLGYTQDEMKDKHLFEFMDEGSAKNAALKLKHRQEGIKEQHEFEFMHKNGTRVYTLIETVPLFDNEGQYTGALASVMNVSERKLAEKAVYESNETLKQAQSVAKIGSWWYDPAKQMSTWTEEMFHIFGLEPQPEAIPYEDHRKIIHPEDWDRFDDAVNRSVTDGIGYNLELEITLPSGEVRHLNTRCEAEKDDQGIVKRVFGTAQDITEKKLSEIELKKQNYYLERAQELGKIGTWELDLINNILVWTDQNCRIFGVPEGSVVDYETFISKVHPEDRGYVDKEWKAGIEGKPYDIEHRLLLDGEVKWVREKANIKFDDNGKAVSAIGFTQDITDRKKMEESLAFEKKRLSMLVEAFPGFIYLQAIDYSIPFANTYFIDHFGDPRHRPCYKVLRNRETPCETCSTFKVFDTKTPQKWEWSEAPDGKIYMIHDYPFIDADGTDLVLEIGTDITEHRDTEKALIETNEMFKRTEAISNVGSWQWDVQPDHVKWSDELFRIFGRDPLNGAPSYADQEKLYVGEDMQRLRDAVENCVNQGTPYELELRAIRTDGEIRHCIARGQAQTDKSDKVYRLVGSLQDITERKLQEKQLNHLERRNKALLDHSPVCHKIVDLDFNLQYMSKNGFEMLKLDHNADVYGKPYPFYFFPEAFKNEMIESLKKVKETGHTRTLEALTNDIEGNEVWLDSSLIPVFNDEKKIDYITVVSANVSERKRDESDKKRLEGQLQQSQKLESIGTLAGGIAHDFNNILSSLIGFTELALDDVEKGSPVEDSLQEIYTGGMRARDLVKQILAFARQSDDAIKPIQIDMIAKEVLKLLRASIPTTIKINQNIEKNLTIMGNPTQFHQMFVNICTNAAQAMEKGGGVLELSIKGMLIDNNDIFNNLNAGDYAEIKISDTGMGIDPEIMDKIFDPYFTTKGIGKGTGMGLALVHGIIQAYNGMITADSLPGKGTMFTVYLPLIRSTGEPASYQPEKLPTGDERILLVDDEAPIVKMSSQILQKLGYMVVSSTSGLKALELFRSTPEDFDLVITDMTMPGITGDKLAAELMSVRRDIPVILCTGYSNQISEKTASDIGIKAFAYKPVSKNDLANTVRKVLDEVKNKN